MRTNLMSMEGRNIPDELQLASLGCALVRTGDLIYIPAGHILLEKSVHEDSLSLRMHGRHVSSSGNAAFRHVAGQMRVKAVTELLLGFWHPV